jgi:hypothetical protein
MVLHSIEGNDMRLSAEQLQVYDEHGFILIPNIFLTHELNELNRHLDQIVAGGDYTRGAGGREGSIHALSLISDHAKQLEHDERLLDLLGDIVKPGIAVYSSKLVTKLPHVEDVCHWHQDDAYFGPSCSTRCSAWIPLQDTDESNGCLWIVPGSHQKGLVTHGTKDWGVCKLSLNEKELDLSKAVPLPATAGSVVIFSALAWHHSKNNQTEQTRRAFIITYQEATAERGGAQWRILRHDVHDNSTQHLDSIQPCKRRCDNGL